MNIIIDVPFVFTFLTSLQALPWSLNLTSLQTLPSSLQTLPCWNALPLVSTLLVHHNMVNGPRAGDQPSDGHGLGFKGA